ncbi:MAG: glycosyltransferase family 4 protein [Candidatus Thermoplasmatota archaeon]|nr:glycosyltransferase family 4 protein [Candidatus Thermoplasmatota archaeon]
MRILTVNYEYPPIGGGGGISHKKLIDEWRKDHHVFLITTHYKGLKKIEKRKNLTIYRVPCMRKGQPTANIISLLLFPFSSIVTILKLKKEKIDIVNTQFTIPSGVTNFFIKFWLKVPIAQSIHGGDIYDPSKKISPHRIFILRYIIQKILRHADLVIAQSKNTLTNAQKYYPFKTDSHIIPLPYDTHELSTKTTSSTFTYIGIGRIIRRKSFNNLIHAFAQVYKQHPQSKLIIVGDGPEKENLENIRGSYGLQNEISIPGYVSEEEKFSLIKNSNCYVLSSQHEGFGIVLQEAMDFALPIVSTNNGGQTDFLTQDVNAELIEPNDIHSLTKAMLKIQNQPKLAEKYGRKNRELIEDFTPDKIAKQHIELFSILIKKNEQHS